MIGIIGAGYQATETALYLRSSGYEIVFFADELVSREEVHDKEGIRYINISEIPRDSKIITAVGDSNLEKASRSDWEHLHQLYHAKNGEKCNLW